MALNIKNADAEETARRLAAVTGESVTRAVAIAVRERLERLEGADAARADQRIARIREISEDAAARWVAPYGSTDHGDLLYDEAGLPR
jgi:antitoxin VapB